MAGVGLGISLCVFGILAVLKVQGGLVTSETRFYDILLRHQPHDMSMASKVVVITLTEEDISRPDVRFPIYDAAIVRVLRGVLDCNPRAVGIDIIRDVPVPLPEEWAEAIGSRRPASAPATEPTSIAAPTAAELIPPSRRALEEIWAQDPRVVQGMLLGQNGRLIGRPANLPEERIALADWQRDSDDKVRRAWLFLGSKESGTYPTLPSLLAQVYLAQENPPVPIEPVPPGDPKTRDLKLGRTVFWHLKPNDVFYVGAETQGIQYLLDYKAPPPESFKHLTVSDVLDGRFRPDDFAGKVVLMGVTLPTNRDELNTPLYGSAQSTFQEAARWGVDMQAMAVDQLLRAAIHGSRPIRFWPDWLELVWTLAWSLVGAVLGWWLRGWRLALAGTVAAGVLCVACWGAYVRGWWIPFLPPAAGALASAFLVTAYVSFMEKADKQIFRQLLSAHVSGDVAEALWEQREQFLEHGRIPAKSVTATVLFSDLKGFSTVSEKMSAEELMAWLNELMGAMADAVVRHGGMVNKYIGDAVMAIFGVPVPRTTDEEVRRDARNAVRCALDMRQTLDRLNQRWKEQGLLKTGKIEMRIGLFTGPLVAGSLGSKERHEYTVIGDTVNTASRLESHDKDLMDEDITALGCRILIGASTNDLLDGSFRTRYIGEMSLKGKDQKVGVYGVICGGVAAAPPGGPGERPEQGSPVPVSPVQGGTAVVSARV